MLSVREARKIVGKTHKGFAPRLVIRDTSGHPFFGYDFGVFIRTWNDDFGYWELSESPLLTSETVWNEDGKFAVRFDSEKLNATITQFKVQ